MSLLSLYTLPPSLAKKPTLCVQCHLHAIHPPKTRRQHHTAPTLWSSNANRVFSELVSDKSLHMKVVYLCLVYQSDLSSRIMDVTS